MPRLARRQLLGGPAGCGLWLGQGAEREAGDQLLERGGRHRQATWVTTWLKTWLKTWGEDVGNGSLDFNFLVEIKRCSTKRTRS